ncbi:MAG TPA: hypothetical protein VLC53_18810, partial [Myxococcota bacterium]|nr:hypothetical protein [Myxococcota bacterium]
RELALLSGLGPVEVQVRIYRHVTREANARALADARRLRQAGHPVYLAMLQDRAAVREPKLWREFAETWLPQFSGIADQVEIGHAVNRVKWGIWDLREYRALAAAVVEVARASGPFRLTGPAVIDFEYHFLAGLLDVLPQDGSLDALSHHLYVDRRGAPENRQGRFAAVEKFALAKAFAGHSGAVDGDRLVISEVNWPIRGTGVYSPVGAPYMTGASGNDGPGIEEERCADYAVRYYALALCSGLVDSVYWWRLVARGFGLVDDSAEAWRPRPAYAAMKQFAQLLGEATFVERMPAPEGAWVLRFRLADGSGAAMAWSHPDPVRYRPAFAHDALLARDGAAIGAAGGDLTLGSSPVYFLGVR